MNAPASPIEQLHMSLPDIDWITDTPRVTRLSQDFSWFSPVLKGELNGKRADIVAKPRNEEEIRQLVAACARLRIPITVRGGGTGNYGQAVPLQGGLLMDMSGYNAFLWAKDGVGRAQAGIRLSEFDKEAQAKGWELRCIPSTFRSATLGGLFGGGFGGAGSITWGPLACPGNVLGVRAITIEPEPNFVELRGAEALAMHHVYGTNGLVLEIEVGLAPAHDWLESVVVFDDFDKALEFSDVIARAPGILKKEVGLLACPVPDYMTTLADHLEPGCHAALLVVAESCEQPMLEYVQRYGGKVTYRQTAAEVKATRRTIIEYAWNHTTLNALKVDKTLTYLQSSFTPGQHLEQVRLMEKLLGGKDGEVLLHAEFLRTMTGEVTCSALQLVRYTTPERLNEIIDIFRANGVRINNPHVYHLEDGKAQGELAPEIIETKKRFDPQGLLNPGKMRTWKNT
ncbi:FAD-binding oxidoreductase [Variovorax sp. VNK109]|uniref:FAD-binding oxidoreductase n=1 Tax=Variovorax sp. VNK109 TaxID=3400919 RepID=UPI003C1250AF